MSAQPLPGVGMRLAAVLLLIALPLVLAAVSALNVLRGLEAEALAGRRAEELAVLEARIARGGPAAAPSLSEVWLPGASASLAAAHLQERLIDIVAGASGRVLEVQEVENEGATDVVVVRIGFVAENEQLLAALHAVETGLPLMNVVALAVAAEASAEAAETESPPLRVDLTVEGYRAEGVTE